MNALNASHDTTGCIFIDTPLAPIFLRSLGPHQSCRPLHHVPALYQAAGVKISSNNGVIPDERLGGLGAGLQVHLAKNVFGNTKYPNLT